MNARQKAKYYKRKYEELSNMPIPRLEIKKQEISLLRATKLFNKRIVMYSDGFTNINRVILEETAKGLFPEVMKNISYVVSEDGFHGDFVKVDVMLKVVRGE